jgi:hypothetical protein
MSMPECSLQEEINKRLTLNLLIQGAAAHTFITAHHLVRDELELIEPGITLAYDKAVVGLHLNYFIGDIALLVGTARQFWRKIDQPDHPFATHTFFQKYGWQLSNSSHRDLVDRGRALGIETRPVLHYFPCLSRFLTLLNKELPHTFALEEIAKRCVSSMWNLEADRMDASLTRDTQFGNLNTPKTRLGRMMQVGAIGYGGVRFDGARFNVVAKAWIWPLLVHELVKGTMELICLHGLNKLNDDTYRQATLEADQIEYETWLLQAGPACWRAFLAVLPRNRPMAEIVMHVARLSPAELDQFMDWMMATPDRARQYLSVIGRI